MSDTIFEIEHRPGEALILRIKSPKLKLIPEPARKHLKTARKEMMLALRSMMDTAIGEQEEKEKPKGKTKISVQ